MKTIDIMGANYLKNAPIKKKQRTSCRAIVIKDNKILLIYESNIDRYMIPGGGIEDDESEKDCVVRELVEETGYIIKPTNCKLILSEYYEV